MVIDKFVFNPDSTLAGASIRMARGAFRFMSGVGSKKAYRIVTPTATIGIRGTEVDVAVDRGLGTAILVFKGAVQLCNRRSGECTLVKAGCGAAISAPDGSLRSPRTGSAKSSLIETSFPLIEQQRRLRQPFRVNTRGCDQVGVPPNTSPVGSRRASVAPEPAGREDTPTEGGGNGGGSER